VEFEDRGQSRRFMLAARVYEWGPNAKVGSSSEERKVDLTRINALLIAESHRGWRNFVARLERLGYNCFVATLEEVRVLLRQRPFRLVLSTRPVTNRGPLMELFREPGRAVFYSFRLVDRFVWFQAVPEFADSEVPRTLRLSDLMVVLERLITCWRSEPSALPTKTSTCPREGDRATHFDRAVNCAKCGSVPGPLDFQE
jgi:hypothetical protein